MNGTDGNLSRSVHKQDTKRWILICLKIGALSFGSAGRSILFRDAVVTENPWITKDEFQEIYTVASILPGPNLINLAAYLGYKLFGTLGGVLGIVALSLPGAVLSLLILWFIPIHNPEIQRVFQGFSIGSFSLYAIFIAQLFAGIKHKKHQGSQKDNTKLFLRISTALVIGTMIFMNVPFLTVLIVGIILCLALEFLL